MNSRPLNKAESLKLAKFADVGLECAFIYLTETGLKKSILDATVPVRELLAQNGVHNFNQQPQGPDNKVILRGILFDSNDNSIETNVSFYRPITKKGDPRIWPYNLTSYANPEDVIALFIHEGTMYLHNLSTDEPLILGAKETPLENFLSHLKRDYDSTAEELLTKLRDLANSGPLEAVCEGDTAIGRTIEAALGIEINSSKKPDYKGIEIKSKRKASTTRSNLFAQVPNWKLSSYKSAKEMVDRIGYDVDGGIRKLYCSVSSRKPNSQGLILDLDLEQKRLHELIELESARNPVCLWELQKLHERLNSKHAETFWISAEEIKKGATKFFRLESVKHTRKPSNQQFDRLLGSGDITVDHLIKTSANGRTKEKGPLFKIKGSALNELFLGESREYLL